MRRQNASRGVLLFLTVFATSPLAIAAEVGVRFDLKLEQSRFDLGPNVRREIDGPYERMIGERGVFLVDRVTGATLAVPNAPLAVPKPPLPPGTTERTEPLPPINYPQPLSEKAEEHSAAVREYLLGVGIPDAEVAGMHVTTTMAGGGPVNQGVQPSRSVLLWYTTHLERSLGGVPVEGSYAFAALDRERRAISEGVYWPAIPARVVARAQALKEALTSSTTRAEFLTRVRRAQPEIGDAEGTVTILHTSAGYHGEFQVEAVYTVIVRSRSGGKAQILRFDDAGSPVRMVDSVESGIDSVKQR
jgi:hypothetical protein